jgi:ATP-binding cassette subfamily F protein 3
MGLYFYPFTFFFASFFPMSILLQLQNGSKAFGGRLIFSDGYFAINEREHIGVIGPNGAGKSTMFRILAEQMELDGGEIVRAKKLRMAYLAQEDDFAPRETLEAYIDRECVLPIWELKRLSVGLGLTEVQWEKPILELSGGYRMRCKLLSLIGKDPNLLLLDEPTNYLDLESLLVLERFLLDFKGAFLVISHDREFLRRTTDHTLEIEGGNFTKYNGNIDDYFEQKALLREQLEKQAMSQAAQRQKVLDFAARFGAKATKARQVQSRLKQLDRMEKVECKDLPLRARIVIPQPNRSGKVTLQLEDMNLGYGDELVLKNVNLILSRGDHVGVVGINGAGKSTLLKALSGELKPHSGTRTQSQGTVVGYYAQHVAEALDLNQTVFEALSGEAHPDVTLQQVRDLAGSLLFSADDTKKKLAVLSGGEKARVALGQILLKKCSCLLLDEPTNHLDFDTVEALTQALQHYSGSLVAVSHDRSFVRRISRKILEIRDRNVGLYPGSYEEYLWSLEKGLWGDVDKAEATSSKEKIRNGNMNLVKVTNSAVDSGEVPINYKQRRKSLEKTIRQLEKQLDSFSKDMESAQEQVSSLTQSLVHFTGVEAQAAAKELYRLQGLITELEGQWLVVSEELDGFRGELESMTTL